MTPRAKVFTFLVVIAFTVAVAASGPVFGTPSDNSVYKPVTVISAADDITVSWQVAAGGSAHLRLYRLHARGEAALVEETIARQGVSSFKVVDRKRPPGATVYQLRVVNHVGVETVLVSALCVERQLSPCSVPMPLLSGHASAQTEEAVDLLVLTSSRLDIGRAGDEGGWIPAPEPPVPRAS